MSPAKPNIKTKRIYDAPSKHDGFRVLVDRLWPRGVPKNKAAIDHWAKELAPTTDLRVWFGHEPARFDEFQARYLDELADNATRIEQLLAEADGRTVTLVYAARDTAHNHAVVLQSAIAARLDRKRNSKRRQSRAGSSTKTARRSAARDR